ncbi:MAG: hypothetical protein HY304_05095 [candidate division Zixibacteria bacterium]|nr:hypothetical protein [candidate division Zixibacteria bacterium]
MVGRTNKPSPRSTRTPSTRVTGHGIQQRRTLKPSNDSRDSGRSSTGRPKKSGTSSAVAKRRVIPPATRADHRPSSTTRKSATFTLLAASAAKVAIAGTFTNWEPQPLTKGPDGLWRISLQLAPGAHQYKFLVDTKWQEDPNNPRKTPNEHGGYNSTCEVL